MDRRLSYLSTDLLRRGVNAAEEGNIWLALSHTVRTSHYFV
jgi:hypothetical protein